MSTGVFPAVFICLCACACAQTPHWCQNNPNQCASFTVLENNEGYQLRQYDAAKWVKTWSYVSNQNWMEVRTVLFRRLFGYIRGNNSINAVMNMTAPVLTKIQPGTPLDPRKVMTMFFLIHPSFQLDTPAPTDTLVDVVSWPDKQVYVRSFGGFARKRESMFHLSRLRSAIGDGALYDNSYVIKASYDPPQRRRNRHNEIWLVKTV